jgi:uncharacterized protein (DUF433 family)
MATAAALSYPHIVTDPRVMEGAPCIAGTRVRVTDVAAAYKAGVTADELCEYFSTRPLTLPEVFAALAYYHDNRNALDLGQHWDEERGHLAERERQRKSR